jgi:Ca-activated chloride channel family protein
MLELANPWMLLAAPLPLLVWWLLPPHRERAPAVVAPFFESTAAAAGLTPRPAAVVLRRTWLQWIVAPLAWIAIVAALVRPEWVEPPITKVTSSRDLLVAIDVSQSMETTDFRDASGATVSRLDAVKAVVSDFVERRPGDRIGLILFGATPYLQAPLTLDHDVVLTLLGDAAIGMAGPMTMLGDAIGLGIRLFEGSQAASRVLILVTDGNDTGSRMPPPRAAEIAKERGLTIYTIVVGNPATTGQKVDEAAMRAVSDRTGGRTFLAQDRRALDEVYRTIDGIEPTRVQRESYRPRRPLFWIPLAAAAVLLAGFYLVMAMAMSIRGVGHEAPSPRQVSTVRETARA